MKSKSIKQNYSMKLGLEIYGKTYGETLTYAGYLLIGCYLQSKTRQIVTSLSGGETLHRHPKTSSTDRGTLRQTPPRRPGNPSLFSSVRVKDLSWTEPMHTTRHNDTFERSSSCSVDLVSGILVNILRRHRDRRDRRNGIQLT